MVKGKKLFSGRLPDDSWNYVGLVNGDDCKFLIYEKETRNKDDELTGFVYWKVLLEPGKKRRKGNYWLSIRVSDGHLVRNKDTKKMVDNMPVLFENVCELIIQYFD